MFDSQSIKILFKQTSWYLVLGTIAISVPDDGAYNHNIKGVKRVNKEDFVPVIKSFTI